MWIVGSIVPRFSWAVTVERSYLGLQRCRRMLLRALQKEAHVHYHPTPRYLGSLHPHSECVLNCSVVSNSFFVTSWTIAHQASLSMEFSSQEYWSGLPFPIPGDLSDPGIEPASLASPTLAGGLFTFLPPGQSVWTRSNEANGVSWVSWLLWHLQAKWKLLQKTPG